MEKSFGECLTNNDMEGFLIMCSFVCIVAVGSVIYFEVIEKKMRKDDE